MVQRLRGRRGVTQRQRRLEAERLCRECRRKGLYRASTVPDHIIPLSKGGSDDDDNIQCLCGPCHARKTMVDLNRKASPTFGLDGWPIEGGGGSISGPDGPDTEPRGRKT